MSDILCSICDEPWDAYGVRHGDMTPDEAKMFLAGEGCPSCGFGNTCPRCEGTGMEPYGGGPEGEPCAECGGSGRPVGGDPFGAAESELDWSDEDPILILQRRGLM